MHPRGHRTSSAPAYPPGVYQQADGPATAEQATPGPSTHDLATMAIQQLADLPTAVRQAVADNLWAQIPVVVQEGSWNPALALNVPLIVTRTFDELVEIEKLIVAVPSGCTGVVQLGAMVIPVSAGTTSLALSCLLNSGDTRSLTISTGSAGPAALWLFGKRLAATGRMNGG